MKKINFCLIPLMLVITAYRSLIGSEQVELKGIKITQNFPTIDMDGKLLRYDTVHINIYTYKDQVLLNTHYPFDSIADGVVVKSELRDYFFVYKKGAKEGYFYDAHKSISSKQVSVDSMLHGEWYNKIHFWAIFSLSDVSLTSQSYNNDSTVLNRLYSFKGKTDPSFTGTCFLGYTQLKNSEYSLSKDLDSIKNMKLYKIRVVNNSRYLKDHKITLDRIEQAFDLEEISISDEKKIMYYFSQ